jgi:hypothetical protein
MFTELLLILFLFTLVFFACYLSLSFFTGAPFVVTPRHIVNEMMLLAKVSKKDIVMDLGSGDGRILIAAAELGAKGYGWEINPFLVLWTNVRAYQSGVAKNVIVACQSYNKANLTSATVVIFYNIPSHLSFIEKKMQKELKPGTKIISYKFPLQKYKPLKETASGLFFYKKI